ncbi:MAG: ATP-binding protein [Actinobacteria bacterium]|nr:ATP-binding protein [Actinomycetota bacterium]MCA1720092.1 ATP-binding protein [Actinomycetota bacterium]
MALVELTLAPLPAHVRTARLVGVAAARRAGLDDALLDELRLAIGEAASRAVGLHARHAHDVPVRITVQDEPGGLTVTVTDKGPAAGPVPDDPATDMLGAEEPDDVADPDVSLAVLSGLVDDCAVDAGAHGTTVTLRWPLPVGAAPGATSVARA